MTRKSGDFNEADAGNCHPTFFPARIPNCGLSFCGDSFVILGKPEHDVRVEQDQ